ncbi:ATP phosphoribosyltransferase [Synechococcus sp. Cruz-9H2]|uniref:ATP phosphoribosyltransferase n=1 Tax=unclassified Synechococcus TaxID=2626047 RepID=UPI0020CFDFFB|nr:MULTISPECIES: ATP phosphoribosyltransferase [unclassified Synechococcus]MCP9818365.1 ATP phosphoribosyltransferase [Synechococcus sp. Cruz-9H2]MCP9842136.1 ATP phosphoribosyltransferase [Synechococcus sp. Edmonson 11F2]MCP9854761.1 ATP phosphoribosyltransferase [Synechococcus sp. Cruz-9C9]MCP9861544.1 ATP phosphoribosyltransferase [Synechococcus sp. Cruz-7E5]MCP9869273.1 ATP phosphoribosyltransferase [Synechococcus sp. Cruz-7B9]
MITVALAKGALLKDSVRCFAAAGLDFSALLDADNRQLMVPSPCGRARALLVRNGDVPVYVAYGQAQLGVVGDDVLREHQLPVAPLLDLGFGGCRMAVAVRENSGYSRAAELPAHCRVASKFVRCAETFFAGLDLPVELIHLTGSVELGPITGMSEAIVDLVATGRTLRDNGLVALDELFHSTARLIGNPLALRFDLGELQHIIDRVATSSCATTTSASAPSQR